MDFEFIPYEIAKKLKEKDFDEPCIAYYHIYEDEIDSINSLEYAYDWDFYNSKNKYRCGAPTISQVLKWLKDKKYIDTEIHLIDGNTTFMRGQQYQLLIYINRELIHTIQCETYEIANLEGIKYIVNNLI